MVHTLLPSKEILHHLSPHVSPLCWCNSGAEESYLHIFFQCEKNAQAGQTLLRCITSYDRGLTQERALRLELVADDPFLLASTTILAIGLSFIWENRKLKQISPLYLMRSELETAISIRRSRLRSLKETAGIMENILDNFFVAVNL